VAVLEREVGGLREGGWVLGRKVVVLGRKGWS
jgi:hypothetical protein